MKSQKNIKTSGEDFDKFLTEIGEKLKKYRLKKGYTSYEQFAFEHNIGRAQYGKYERGTEDLRLSSLFKVLKMMDISWEEFFKGIK
ncbi:MAG: helix-turn-helix transcriptional regulator [Chitinophagaceae bacterium]